MTAFLSAMVVAPAIETASIGIPDTLFLMLLALVVFGPRRLPEIGRQIGKLMYEFRKVSNDFKYQMEEELRASEEADRQKKLAAIAPTPVPSPVQPALAAPVEPVAQTEASSAGEIEATADIGAADTETAAAVPASDFPALEGEVRGEPRRFPHDQLRDQLRIQPPASGEPVAAPRPFRTRAAFTEDDLPGNPSNPLDPVHSVDPVPAPEVISEPVADSAWEVHHG